MQTEKGEELSAMNRTGKLSEGWWNVSNSLSWDAILFVLLWGGLFVSSELSGLIVPTNSINLTLVAHLSRVLAFAPLSAFLVITLILYIAADQVLVGSRQFLTKLIALWIVVIAFVIAPTIAAILYRHTTLPFLYIHDGAIQIEEAIKFMLAGKNPYVENYLATPMAQWPFHEPGLEINPALYHLIYLPGMLLISIPFYLLSQVTLGWYDQRFVYLLMLFGLTLLLLQTAQTSRAKLATLMITLLNPLLVPFFIEGRNDIIVLFWLVGAIFFLQRNRMGWAGVWVALAAGSKQTAWFLLPFFVLYVLGPSARISNLAHSTKRLVPGIIAFAVLILPFLLWNPGAFLGDTINYQTGISPSTINYPIKSLGLGDLLLGIGLIGSSQATFPFSILQIFFGGLALVVLLWRQWKHNTLRQMIFNYAILFFVFAFFSRTFNDNHLGFALTLFILPSFLADADPLTHAIESR